MKKILFSVILILAWLLPQAQQFGGNRFSTRWRQIDSDTVRIIYPVGLDSSAATVASVVHRLAARNPVALGSRLKKIDMVLQPHTVISNAYVGLGPYRSEFYMIPPADNFDLGTVKWAEQLALHEYRHVHQYNNFYNGAGKTMRWLFGEEGYALAANAAIPNWFFEGDAVFQETILSPQGRGRLPSFLKAYPALWKAGKRYSWMKLRNGSYRDYVPNHYDLGYLIVNYGYEKYGTDFWKKVTTDASAFKGGFYPMQRSVKKYSGLHFSEFTTQALYHYKNIYEKVWNQDVHKVESTQSMISERANASGRVTNFFFPHQIAPDSLLYLKTSYTKRPAFYIQDRNGEHLLRYRDISIDEQYSYRNGKIVYTAFETHPRWQWHNYSVIKILDIQTKEQKTLSQKTRYFAPDISQDGKVIVANRVSVNGNSSLVLLSSNDGRVITDFAADSIAYFSNPKFLTPRKIVSAIRLQNAKTFIGIIDLIARHVTAVTPASYNAVGHIAVLRNTVYFTAAQGLKDEIFSVDIITQKMKKLVSNELFRYFPNAGFEKISYNYFTASGYRVQQLENTKEAWEPVNTVAFSNNISGIVSERHVNNGLITDTVMQYLYTSKPYSRFTRPFHFHSWRPNYDQPVFDCTIYGNNVLNTVETQLQYQYNQNDHTHAVGASLVYGGLFPFINIGSKYIFDRKAMVSKKLKEWNQWENYIGVNIPLTWASHSSYKFFNWGMTYARRTDFNRGHYSDNFRTVRFGYLQHQFSWAQQVQKARLDILPRWGYNISAQFRHALTMYSGWQFYSRVGLFMPGIFTNHGVHITGAFQEADVKDRIFANRFPFARGFHAVDSARVAGAALNYHFPVAYPDFGFANIFYLLRVRANLFCDYTRIIGKTSFYKKEMLSTGAELFLDTKWWNQHPITFGVRGGYQLKPDPVTRKQQAFVAFILPVTLIPR